MPILKLKNESGWCEAVRILVLHTCQRINFSLHQRRRMDDDKEEKKHTHIHKSELGVQLHLRIQSLAHEYHSRQFNNHFARAIVIRITFAIYFITIGKLWNSLPPESLCEIVNFLRILIICSLFVVLAFLSVFLEPSLDYNSTDYEEKHLDAPEKVFIHIHCWNSA